MNTAATKQASHTPGPWTAFYSDNAARWYIDASVDGQFQLVTTMNTMKAEEMAANAQLIAAAPDLLEILLELKEHGLSWDPRYDDVIAKATQA